MNYTLGIDLGTSYFKVGLFDDDLQLCGLGRVAVPTTAAGDRREVAVEAFWETLRQGLKTACNAAGTTPDKISGLSWSSQANSFLLLDGNGEPLTPLILWTDNRAPELPAAVQQLAARPDFTATTGSGVGLGRGSAVTKLVWMREQDAALWRRTTRILTIADYLAYSLTGRFQGDGGTASLLGLMDQRAIAWWPEALATVAISPAQLVTPLRPGTPIGPVSTTGAARLGLTPGVQVAAGSLDHHAAALGAGLGTVAPASESTGTVLAAVGEADAYQPRKGLCHLPATSAGKYALLVFSGNGAGVLEWYQRNYASEISFRELDQLAAAVPADCDGLVALPQAHKEADLTGFTGRQPQHGPGHYARAIMTSVADTLGELLERLSPGKPPQQVVATGGGAHSPFWLQLKRERLGIDIAAADTPEPACRGAALLYRLNRQS